MNREKLDIKSILKTVLEDLGGRSAIETFEVQYREYMKRFDEKTFSCPVDCKFSELILKFPEVFTLRESIRGKEVELNPDNSQYTSPLQNQTHSPGDKTWKPPQQLLSDENPDIGGCKRKSCAISKSPLSYDAAALKRHQKEINKQDSQLAAPLLPPQDYLKAAKIREGKKVVFRANRSRANLIKNEKVSQSSKEMKRSASLESLASFRSNCFDLVLKTSTPMGSEDEETPVSHFVQSFKHLDLDDLSVIDIYNTPKVVFQSTDAAKNIPPLVRIPSAEMFPGLPTIVEKFRNRSGTNEGSSKRRSDMTECEVSLNSLILVDKLHQEAFGDQAGNDTRTQQFIDYNDDTPSFTETVEYVGELTDVPDYFDDFVSDDQVTPQEYLKTLPIDHFIHHLEFPQLVRELSQQVPAQEILPTNEEFIFFFAEIFSPAHFWFHADYKSETMNKDMGDDYKNLKPHQLAFSDKNIKKGMLVACYAPEFDAWYRAVVIEPVDENGMARVLFLEYGTVAQMNKKHIKYLFEKYLKIPRLSYRGRFVNVKPPNGKRQWEESEVETIQIRYANKRLYATVVRYDEKEKCYELKILKKPRHGVKGKKILDLRDWMITKHIAEPFELQEGNINPMCYYFPTFDSLETGGFPSFHEKSMMNSNGSDHNVLVETKSLSRINLDCLVTNPKLLKMLLHERNTEVIELYFPHPNQTQDDSEDES